VTAPAQYSQRLSAFVLYLLHYQLLPEKRPATLMSDLFGVRLETAIVARISQDCARRSLNNAGWQRDLSVSYGKVAVALPQERSVPQPIRSTHPGWARQLLLIRYRPRRTTWCGRAISIGSAHAYPVSPHSDKIWGDGFMKAGFFRLPTVGVCDNRIGKVQRTDRTDGRNALSEAD
jgi:hypothetical protein